MEKVRHYTFSLQNRNHWFLLPVVPNMKETKRTHHCENFLSCFLPGESFVPHKLAARFHQRLGESYVEQQLHKASEFPCKTNKACLEPQYYSE